MSSPSVLVIALHSSQLQQTVRKLRLLKWFCTVLGADLAIPHRLLLRDADVARNELATNNEKTDELLTNEASELSPCYFRSNRPWPSELLLLRTFVVSL